MAMDGGLRRVCERCVQVRFGLAVRVADAIFAWQAKILRCVLLPRPAERVAFRTNGGRRLFSYTGASGVPLFNCAALKSYIFS